MRKKLHTMESHCKTDNDVDMVNGTIRKDDIYRIPPEIWEAIFDNLLEPWEVMNVCETEPYWESILYPTRSSWLFCLAFPLLLEHLSKNEVMECRRVCKRWCFGVDHFLEHNSYHRPASNEGGMRNHSNYYDPSTKGCKTDNRLRPLVMTLYTKRLTYNLMKQAKRETLLKEAVNHPRCPIVGRSACVMELPRELLPTNPQFLQIFGHHIWFLKIAVGNLSPVESLKRILKLITYTSNLKKLDIYGTVVPPRIRPSENTQSFVAEVEVQLSSVPLNITTEDRERLPKLETLDTEMTGMCHAKIKEILLTLFCNRNLQSLAMNLVAVPPNLEMTNLTDLSLSLDSDTQLSNLLQCTAPLRRFCLNLCGSVTASLLFNVVRHFEPTLRNFGLQLSPEFYTGSLTLHDLSTRLLSMFKVTGALDCLNLKRTSLRGCRPASLNYLCGLQHSLQYLHIYIDNLGHWENFIVGNAKSLQEYEEELDLLDSFKGLNFSNKLTIYKSNVWRIFPRLKVLTVMLWNDGDATDEEKKVEWEYRRDTYEYLLQQPATINP